MSKMIAYEAWHTDCGGLEMKEINNKSLTGGWKLKFVDDYCEMFIEKKYFFGLKVEWLPENNIIFQYEKTIINNSSIVVV